MLASVPKGLQGNLWFLMKQKFIQASCWFLYPVDSQSTEGKYNRYTEPLHIVRCNLYRKAERERVQTYQQDLHKMKQRVQQRPLLFEQAAQVCFVLSRVVINFRPLLLLSFGLCCGCAAGSINVNKFSHL